MPYRYVHSNNSINCDNQHVFFRLIEKYVCRIKYRRVTAYWPAVRYTPIKRFFSRESLLQYIKPLNLSNVYYKLQLIYYQSAIDSCRYFSLTSGNISNTHISSYSTSYPILPSGNDSRIAQWPINGKWHVGLFLRSITSPVYVIIIELTVQMYKVS